MSSALDRVSVVKQLGEDCYEYSVCLPLNCIRGTASTLNEAYERCSDVVVMGTKRVLYTANPLQQQLIRTYLWLLCGQEFSDHDYPQREDEEFEALQQWFERVSRRDIEMNFQF